MSFIVIAADVAPVPPTVTQCTGIHQVYNGCGSACAPTCDNYKDASVACIDLCVDGCFCEPGYVKNTVTDTCVLPAECAGKYLIYWYGNPLPRLLKNRYFRVTSFSKDPLWTCFCELNLTLVLVFVLKLLQHNVQRAMNCTMIAVLLALSHVITTKLLLHVQRFVQMDVSVNLGM